MSNFVKALSVLSFGLLLACAPQGEAVRSGGWALSKAESSMSYVTIKNGNIGEVNTFRDFSGSVSANGDAEFKVALDSVDTSNETRDPRMKTYVFETDKFSHAVVSANLNMSQFEALAIGNSKTVTLGMKLDLHGIVDERELDMLVTRLGANKVRVDSQRPILIDGEDFGFEAGLAKLQELAKLNSITPVVSATVSLTFER